MDMKQIRVVHSGSLNVRAGGPALSLWLCLKGLKNNGVDAVAVSEPIADGDLVHPLASPVFTQKTIGGSFAYVPGMADTLDQAGEADLYHVQGVWMLHGWQTARYARKHHKPYMVTLRGMLYPQALSGNKYVKQLALGTYQGYVLRHAAAVQCTCEEEMEHFRALGFNNPVAIIPNAIETDGIIDRPMQPKTKLRIGYLGRVHPRKRIEKLIYAFDTLRDRLGDAKLIVIGADDEEYLAFLKGEASRLNLPNVEFTGFLSGNAKDEAISSLSYLAVPSDFENFGNIVSEALVRGVPVYSSTGTPWQKLEEYGCGWWRDNSQESINDVIAEMIATPEEERLKMGENARTLVKNNLAVDYLGMKMKTLYKWILEGGNKPDFVY